MSRRTVGLTVLLVLSAAFTVSRIGGDRMPTATVQAAPVSIAQAPLPRLTNQGVALADLDEQVAGNNAFALALYQELQKQVGNLVYSPYSISTALAMVYAGARGQTERQMATVLHYVLPQARLHPAFNALDLRFAARGGDVAGGSFRLKVANSTWGQIGYPFMREYLDLLAENYGAGIRLVDFAVSPEPARLAINQWVENETEGKIVDLAPERLIGAGTRLVVVNAIYFKADWKYPFHVELTRDGPFTLLDGRRISVPMMRQEKTLLYSEGDGYQAVALPYVGDELAMIIILPDADDITQFEGKLTAELVDLALGDAHLRPVDLTLPKFTYKSQIELRQTLSEMGMPDAFGAADFSGINSVGGLHITDVIHQAFIAVNERGTEASAATVAALAGKSKDPIVTFTVDHPFIFLVRDLNTGTTFFVGRVLDPTASQ